MYICVYACKYSYAHKACLLAVGQLKLAKEDFSRLLDQKPENL